MSNEPISLKPKDRAFRLRGYLARQKWTLYREWTQQQEDAWWLLNEMESLIHLIQRIGDPSDLEVQNVLANHGRPPRGGSPSLPVS